MLKSSARLRLAELRLALAARSGLALSFRAGRLKQVAVVLVVSAMLPVELALPESNVQDSIAAVAAIVAAMSTT